MKRLLIFLSSAVIAIISGLCAGTVTKGGAQAPDFAFPKKVEQRAERDLKEALRTGNGDGVVNALIRKGLAQTAVSLDSLPVVLAGIDKVMTEENNPVTKSLLALLEADIYSQIYTSQRWTIDQRPEIVAQGITDDYNLWNRAMFERKVRSLVSGSLGAEEALKNVPVTDYGETVEIDRGAVTFYPTMFDFTAWRGITYLNRFASYSSSFPYALLNNPFDVLLYQEQSLDGEILSIYRRLASGRLESAPGMLALSGAMGYVAQRVFTIERPVFDFTTSRENNSEENEARAYLEAYRRHIGRTPYAVELLTGVRRVAPGWGIARKYYDALSEFEREHPDYFNIGGVRQILADMRLKNVSVCVPYQIEKGKEFTVTASVQNVNELTVKLYKLRDQDAKRGDTQFRGSLSSLGAPVRTATVNFTGEVPFEAKGKTALSVDDYGRYLVVTEFPGEEKTGNRYWIINCSDLATSVVQDAVGLQRGVVMNVGNGAPVAGASMVFSPWDRRATPAPLEGVTDANGFIDMKIDKPGTVYATLGADRFSSSVNAYLRNQTQRAGGEYGALVTSLGVYKPGDTMEYAAVLYRLDQNGRQPLSARQFTVRLRDANYQEVATSQLTTDGWGRAQGEFALPEDGLTGSFTLEITDEGIRNGRCSFMVSDYKLPTFEAKITSTRRPAARGDEAVIEGVATTYAGFPVESAQVRAQLNVRTGGWWFARVTPVFFETETTTGSDGKFTVTIPADVIASAPITDGYFVAEIAVTSQDGETHTVTGGFNMGKPDYIRASIPGEYNAASGQEIKVELLDYDNKPQTAELQYKISDVRNIDGVTTYPELVEEGTFQPGDFGKILSALPSGRYGVILATTDTALADPTGIAEVTVWRPTDKVCFADRLLWLPESTVTADSNGRAEVILGSNAPGNHVLLVLSDENGKIVTSRWLEAKGMQTVDVQMPNGTTGMKGFLSTVRNCEMGTATFIVKQASGAKSIKIHTTTFRDKVTPGDKERITLKVSGTDGALTESALMLDMSSKAVDAIAANRFAISPATSGMLSPYISYPDFRSGWFYGSSKGERFKSVSYAEPEFRMYGRSFIREGVYNLAGVKIRGSRKMAMGANDVVEEEAADENRFFSVSEKQEYLSGSVTAMAADAGSAMLDEAVATSVEEEADGEADDNGISYRPSELPLAFFKPMLTTDSEGNIEVEYTVPDANTTWVLRSLAYNRDLLTATDQVEIVASKPVMVSANAPRFVRCGDKVRLPAMVMNATDSAVVVRSVVEILTVDGKQSLAVAETTDSLAATGSLATGVEFDVPDNLGGVIFRVGATTGNFTDGEQVFIPILPSEQNVVETSNFYLAPGENHFTMSLPAVENGRAYLKYTGNPAWEVVSALPGLRDGEMTSSLTAAGELYAAAVADGLMNRYPEIARTIRKWADNPSDSALVSMLEKNSGLKDMLLNSTPWVSDAMNETERMQRLVLLLDRRNTSKAAARAIAVLKKTFVSGQGWCWTNNYPEYSEWCTMQILDILGGLNRLGWLPDNKTLKGMVDEAVKYADKRTATEFAKYPKSDFTSYCHMRMKYPDIKLSTAASGVVSAQVSRIVSSWKDHGVTMKAVDALILNANGYAATARQILASLTEYATVTSERGMWWSQLDNRYSFWSMNKVGSTAIILDAYAAVTPSAPEVDRIRQWLVLNKADNSWGNAIITTQVVTSLLCSGSNWTVNSSATAVRVNGTMLTPSEEYATGAFTEQITPLMKRAGELVIDRQGNYPSFGGVVTMRDVPMSDVRPVGSDELTVEKYMSVFNGSEWMPSDHFSVGNRVKVTITVKAGKDMSYMVINDKRAAGLEPVEQLPGPVYADGLCFYRENRDAQTNIFIDFLPKGTYMLEYELFAAQAGGFASGVAQAQSQYNPLNTAHSAGARIIVTQK